MNAIYFDKSLLFRNDLPIPEPADHEALVKITKAGICSTDIEITKGYMGFVGIPGHEFTGIVESSSENALIGKRVTGEINIGCGKCSYCINGLSNHCPSRSVLGILNRNGAFAEYITLPNRNLHPIPDSVSDEEAVFVEPLAAAFEILEQVSIKKADRVCVLGDGKLGLLTGMVINTTGCDLTVVGKHSRKLSILRDQGIKTVLSSEFEEKEFDIVVECTGSSSGTDKALEIVIPKGILVLKSTIASDRGIDLNKIVINEINIIGSRCGPFSRAIEAIAKKEVNILPLITASFPLEEGLEAFESAMKAESLKVLFEIR